MKNKCLVIIDPQNDFISGTLPVSGAGEIMDGVARYIEKYGNEYAFFAVSCDFHPINHSSFKENGGPWPIHCVYHSNGAAVYQPIMTALTNQEVSNKIHTVFLPKGTEKSMEEYSAFVRKQNQEVLSKVLEANKIEQIDICGIAGDYCVLESIKGLCNMGHKEKLFVLADFCPSIDDGSTLKNYLKENNIKNNLN